MPRIDLKPAPQLLFTEHTRLEVPRAEHAEAFRAGVSATAPVLQYVDWRPNPDLAWARRFCRAGGADRDLLLRRVAEAWEQAAPWPGPDDDPGYAEALAAGMLACGPDEVRRQVREWLTDLLAAEGCSVELA